MTRRSTNIGTGAAVFLLGAALGFGVVDPASSNAAGTGPGARTVSIGTAALSPGAPAQRSRGNPLWAISLSTLTATNERPLFSASRRPPSSAMSAPVYTPVATIPEPVEPDHPQWSLNGTIASETEGFGFFLDHTTNRIVKLKMGESYNGWVVRRVWRGKAQLEKNNVTAFLIIPAPNTKSASSDD